MVTFEENTDIDNVYFAFEETDAKPTVSLKSLVEGIEEDELEGLAEDEGETAAAEQSEGKEGMQREDVKGENVEKQEGNMEKEETKKEDPKRQNKEDPKKQQNKEELAGKTGRREENRVESKGKGNKKTEPSKKLDDFFQEIMDVVEILNNERELLSRFADLTPSERQALSKEMRRYIKEFPELEPALENAEEDPEGLLEVLDRVEERFPEFRVILKDLLIRTQKPKREREQKTEDERPRKK